MASEEVNWVLVIGGGVLTGLLILAVITGLYLLLAEAPAAEPPERPEGMLTWRGEPANPTSQNSGAGGKWGTDPLAEHDDDRLGPGLPVSVQLF